MPKAEIRWKPARRSFLVGFALFVVTLILYWPATSFQFIAYDDELYVYENPAVIKGLSWSGLKWSLTAVVGANWHPLTVVSHMLDCSIFGLFAGGHHLTNILLHSVNALLLFLLLKRMTRSFWPAALVAALFAWHPLNVESVAWVAERKNVLSMLFLILTVWAYLRYAERPAPGRYGLALALFVLGLMSKPMLVTLPVLLLLLDYWPLGRMPVAPEFSGPPAEQRIWGRLVWEKIPFFACSVAAGAATFIAQSMQHSVKSLQDVPLSLRVLNAPVACATYLAKAVWPAKLCIFYPLPSSLPIAPAVGSSLLLAAATGLVFHWRFKFRWLFTGWLWFLIALLPVIGLVQTGTQAMADRHAYMPLIGLFLIVAWGLHHGLQSRPSIRPFAAIAAVLILGSCLVLTRIQLAHWRDGIALFTQAVRATKNNFAAHNILGVVLANAGRTTEAITQYEEALRLKPDDVESHYHLGLELMDLGKFSEAGWHFSEALKRMPDNVVLLNNLGVALAQSGEPAGAGERFRRAIQLSPEYPKPYFNYGKILAQLGQNGQAFTNFMTALRLEPDWPEALNQAARFLATCPESKWRNPSQAMACAERANEITGHESPVYLETLALTWAVNGNFSNAVSTAELAVQKARAGNPGDLADKIAGELNVYRTGQIPQMDKTAPSAYKAPHP